MTSSRAVLTELEGAILGVLRRGPGLTPYAVRKLFLGSRSAEWSGSAGAVYPAIARLERAGLLAGTAGADARGTQTYRLSAEGIAAHDLWLCDVARIAGPGVDPFRTRVALWSFLPARKRQALMRQLESEIRRQRDAIVRQLASADAGDRVTDALLVAQLDLRLAWLKGAL